MICQMRSFLIIDSISRELSWAQIKTESQSLLFRDGLKGVI